jgi:hypothetical protein
MKHLIPALFILILFGCDTENGTSDLSVSNIFFELREDGFIQWYSNDPQYYNHSHRRIYENNNDQNIYEIECKKVSGYGSQWYGMIFGASNSTNNKYCRILITINGSYYIDKIDDGKMTIIKDLENSDKLYTGYDKTNNIKVTKSGTTYTVFLNTNQVFQFNDTSITGNKIGYYVSVGSETNESFPNTPVDVRFRQK